jgi:hypothetical protein
LAERKRELAISFRQQKKGYRAPQPLDEQPATVTARIKVNGSWIERAMAYDTAKRNGFIDSLLRTSPRSTRLRLRFMNSIAGWCGAMARRNILRLKGATF